VEDVSSGTPGAATREIRPSDLAGIELRHAIPGRIRLRIPAIKGEPGLSREVQRQLSALAVIRRVEVNPVTGSVLVLFDPADSAAIAQLGRMMIPGLDLVAMPRPDDLTAADGNGSGSTAEAVAEFGRQLNEKVQVATGHAADLKFLVPASLLVGGLVRLIASRKVPSPTWYDLLWFAFGTYFTLNRGQAREEPLETSPESGLPA
jgi:Heavy metal associated domain 2